tara:strand:- start:7 stop:795 length:789 start_codon:yes stop_codon:yes gene_type:complete
MSNPYFINEKAVISFSGGRSSAFMLYRILEAHNFILPNGVEVIFTNTGKEMPQTLDFVRDCEKEWNCPITWLEYRSCNKFVVVDYESASRNGEPFEQLIKDKQFLPNTVMRFCTQELKIRTIERYFGKNHVKYLGIRGDEQRRVSRIRGKDDGSVLPLATSKVTKKDINDFWITNKFDLNLPSANTNTLSNCDLCFLKGTKIKLSIVEHYPDLANWWVNQEKKVGAVFNKDSPSYARMQVIASDQGQLFDFDDESISCFCGD